MFTIRDRITSGFRPEIPPTLPELSQLISACWATKPEDRPDITQCHVTLSATIKSKFPEISEFVSLSTPAVPGIEQGATDCDDQFHLSTMVLSPRQFTDTAGSVKCMRGLKWKQVWCGDGAGNITVFTEVRNFCSTPSSSFLFCHSSLTPVCRMVYVNKLFIVTRKKSSISLLRRSMYSLFHSTTL
jgi:hypothetical protein